MAVSTLLLAAAVYGATAHLSRNEFNQRSEVCSALASVGAPYVRADFDWGALEPKPGCWRFDRMDAVMASAASAGVTVLPILGYNTHYAKRAYEHLDKWTNYVATVLARYPGKIPVVEVWNEENWKPFWTDPDPTNYCALLKATYAAVKATDPSVRVSVGGLAGVPLDYMEGLYAAGAKGYYDIMSVHPYCQPYPPEGTMEEKLDSLRRVMDRHGDNSAVWITEIGWPTPSHKMASERLFREALSQADPQRKTWNALFIDCCAEWEKPNGRTVEMLRKALPEGSSVEGSTPGRAAAMLSSGRFQLCVYPFSDDWPADSFDAVVDFVSRGGMLLDFGGMPMVYAYSTNSCGALSKNRSIRMDRTTRRLRVEPLAWWYRKELPRSMETCFASGGESLRAVTFFGGGWLARGDRLIPLLTGETNGVNVAGACVYRFGSDRKGSVAVSGVREAHAIYGIDEERQALYTLRAMGMAAGFGVEGLFLYECVDTDRDAFDPESYFGMFRSDFSEKPVARYARRFIVERPAGSVPFAAEWRDRKAGVYRPQWTTPLGLPAGMIWTVSAPRNFRLTFDAPGVSFRDVSGAAIKVDVPAESKVVEIRLSDSPMFFSGGRLLSAVPFGVL